MNRDFITDCTEISQADLLPANPIVSVLMITYNHAQFLGEAIEGIAKQVTEFPIEIVIGEDCSPDDTRQVALSYQKKYPKLIRVLYSEKNIGVNKNVARVLAHCRGPYVAICEGDDYWIDVEKLQKQVHFLQENPTFVATYHRNILVDNMGKLINNEEENPNPWQDYSKEELLMGAYMQTLTLCFRNVIGELPPEFFKVLTADTFLRSILGQHGSAKYIDDIEPCAYRIHDGGIWRGITTSEQRIGLSNAFFWISIYYKRIGNTDISNKYSLMSLDHFMSSLEFDKAAKNKFLLKQVFPGIFSTLGKVKRLLKK